MKIIVNRKLLPLAALTALLPVAFSLAAYSQNAPDKTTPAPKTSVKSPALKLDLDGVDNVFRLSKKIISGAAPQGATGFRSLRRLGVRTIITVDSARPEVELAKKYGMRYVHLPIGYNGMTRERELEIGRAARDLPGPIFIHCHHGLHRGPAAAVVAALINDSWTIEQAVATMEIAGTSPSYTGLYCAATDFKPVSKAELDHADNSFPAVSPIEPLAQTMVQIDEQAERLKDARAAGWKVSAAHPDIDPPHEALMLQESFREIARTKETQACPESFRKFLQESETAAGALQIALREKDKEGADAAFADVMKNCGSCHREYRNAAPVQER